MMASLMGKWNGNVAKVVFGHYDILCIIVSNVCEVPMILIYPTCQSYQQKPEYKLVVSFYFLRHLLKKISLPDLMGAASFVTGWVRLIYCSLNYLGRKESEYFAYQKCPAAS